MIAPPLLLLFLFFIQCFSLSAAGAATDAAVQELCMKSSGYVGHGFCVRVLNSVPGHNISDLPSLAAFTLKLSAASATSTRAKLTTMAAEEASPSARNSLQACLHLYSDAIPPLEASAELLAAKDVVAAKAMIGATIFAPTYCKTTLQEKLLNKENDRFSKLLLLLTAITNLISS